MRGRFSRNARGILVACTVGAALVGALGLAFGEAAVAAGGLVASTAFFGAFALYLIVTERRRHESAEDELQAQALRRAVENARKKAEALADAAGVSLGRVTAITEGYAGGPQPYYAAEARLAKAGAPVDMRPHPADNPSPVRTGVLLGEKR